jgi:hypothetical protein
MDALFAGKHVLPFLWSAVPFQKHALFAGKHALPILWSAVPFQKHALFAGKHVLPFLWSAVPIPKSALGLSAFSCVRRRTTYRQPFEYRQVHDHPIRPVA